MTTAEKGTYKAFTSREYPMVVVVINPKTRVATIDVDVPDDAPCEDFTSLEKLDGHARRYGVPHAETPGRQTDFISHFWW